MYCTIYIDYEEYVMSRRQDDDWDAQPITNKQKQQVEAAVKLTVEKYGGTLKLLEEDEQPIKQPDTKDKTLLTETDLRKQLEETPIHYLKAVSEPNFYLSSESINWIVALIKQYGTESRLDEVNNMPSAYEEYAIPRAMQLEKELKQKETKS